MSGESSTLDVELEGREPSHASLGSPLATAAHALLIEEAAKWLRAQGCTVVITDMTHGQSETADAIGWKGMCSTLVECKVSRGDFFADKKKFFRRFPDQGMGGLRYFCAPRGMLKPEELPANWGLLEWDGSKLRRAVRSGNHETHARTEISLLISAIRRLGRTNAPGVSVRHYTFESGNRATLGIEAENKESA